MPRFSEVTSKLPPSTLGIIALCCSLYLIQATTNVPALRSVTMCPRDVIYNHQYYRIITSALFHGGIMHLLMNMMSTLALSSLLERELGTIRHLFTVVAAILFTGLLYLLLAYAVSAVFMDQNLMDQHAVGFSGVLFQMLVMESNLIGGGNRSLFGVITVPSWLYPWVL
jgi:membrane associated rhomboid family serine protease